MDFIADTTLLVGLWRRQDWAIGSAREHPDKALGLPWVVLGEFWHGAIRAGHDRDRVREFLLLGIPLMDPAAVGLTYDKPLVTRNRRHFGAINELTCVGLVQEQMARP